jgi:IgA Peptidase M64.
MKRLKWIAILIIVFIFLNEFAFGQNVSNDSVRLEHFKENGTIEKGNFKKEKYKTKVGKVIQSVFAPPQTVFKVDTIAYYGADRLNVIYLGDGYTANQQGKYKSDVLNSWNKFLTVTPFKEKATSFNVFAIEVISQDSGAKHPNTASDCFTSNPPVPVSNPNTYFGATFDYGGIHRLLYCVNTSAIQTVLSANFSGVIAMKLILVNTPYYGGSGGTYAIASTDISSASIMIHETGHSFGGLGDEYGGSYCGGTELPNVTQQTDRTLIKWKDLILPTTPIPTTNGTLCTEIGLYEGANYCNTKWYRPKCNCTMNMLGVPFCAVCWREINNKIPSVSTTCVPSTETKTIPCDAPMIGTKTQTRNKLSDCTYTAWITTSENCVFPCTLPQDTIKQDTCGAGFTGHYTTTITHQCINNILQRTVTTTNDCAPVIVNCTTPDFTAISPSTARIVVAFIMLPNATYRLQYKLTTTLSWTSKASYISGKVFRVQSGRIYEVRIKNSCGNYGSIKTVTTK